MILIVTGFWMHIRSFLLVTIYPIQGYADSYALVSFVALFFQSNEFPLSNSLRQK